MTPGRTQKTSASVPARQTSVESTPPQSPVGRPAGRPADSKSWLPSSQQRDATDRRRRLTTTTTRPRGQPERASRLRLTPVRTQKTSASVSARQTSVAPTPHQSPAERPAGRTGGNTSWLASLPRQDGRRREVGDAGVQGQTRRVPLLPRRVQGEV